ncbi:hypothetical protein CANCADRAFT_140095 [Tortispora caseinolytica NRRL Y-17796]|uniref:Uncharacterized protein n=1 Tax=Tortispora caseinolytica NRRL Y-17796 TaxID=767744 RepID=A0A1E4TCR6_9ASCO|nr:hypothetical protein CANCADRAFT_140095 [Tortispora caseinolytica NRRL Y-17796]
MSDADASVESLNRLKRKWEDIERRYSRNFEDVSDVIDIMSGKIILDNGHLSSLKASKAWAEEDSDLDDRKRIKSADPVHTIFEKIIIEYERLAMDGKLYSQGHRVRIESTDQPDELGCLGTHRDVCMISNEDRVYKVKKGLYIRRRDES